MAFWDKVKGVANDAVNTLSDAAKDVTDSAKEMNEKSKLNRAIKTEEGKIYNLYRIIGEKIFNENSSAPAGLEDQFAGINAAKKEIERLKSEFSNIEAAAKCPKCGSKINQSQKFCQSCGYSLNQQSTAQPAAQSADNVIVTQGQEVAESQPVQTAENTEENK